MIHVVRVPKVNPNDDVVTLVNWHVKDGDWIPNGGVICSVETTKAIVDIETESEGYIVISARESQEVATQGTIAFLVDSLDITLKDCLLYQEQNEETQSKAEYKSKESGVSEHKATIKAQVLAQALGVDLTLLHVEGIIRETHVRDYFSNVRHADMVEVSTRDALHGEEEKGRIDKEFLDILRGDQGAFSGLSSASKVRLYRKHGARIGHKVVLSPGSLILAAYVDLGDEVFLGENVVITCTRLKLGRLTQIGRGSTLSAQRITFGENVFFSHNVEVGGGGAMDPESEIEIGSHCHIGQDVHLNCCRKITIGEETTITMGTMIMTHSFANSVLEGYPVVFAPVRIGNHALIGLRCVVFPGTTVGDGAVIGSNSSVVSDIGPGLYATGVPAKVIGNAKRALSPERQHKITTDIMHEFLQHLSLRGIEVDVVTGTPFEIATTITHGEGRGYLFFSEYLDPRHFGNISFAESTETIGVCLRWGGSEPTIGHLTLMELLAKRIHGPGGLITDALREFLRKRGIRLEPRTWTYPGGLL